MAKRLGSVSLVLALVSACAGKAKNDVAVGPPPGRAHRDGPDQDRRGQGPGRRPPGDLRRRRAVRARRQGAGRQALRRRDHRLRAAAEGVPRRQQVPAAQPLQRRARLPGQEGLGEGRRRRSRRWRRWRRTRSDTKDALFQLGATYAEMGNWPTSATIFAAAARAQGHERGRQDRGDARAAGFAQFQLKDLDTAERTFSSALYFFRSIEKEERLQTDFYLGLVKYHLGQIPHERFRAHPAAAAGEADGEGHGRQGAPAAVGPAPVHRDDQDGQPAVGVGVRATRSGRCTRSSTTPSSTRRSRPS